eukprot:c13630_g1_i1 orf=204-464(+)
MKLLRGKHAHMHCYTTLGMNIEGCLRCGVYMDEHMPSLGTKWVWCRPLDIISAISKNMAGLVLNSDTHHQRLPFKLLHQFFNSLYF